MSELKTDAAASLEDTDVEQNAEIVSEISTPVPAGRTMGPPGLLLGLLWLRSALLCAGEPQQCIHTAVMPSAHTSFQLCCQSY